MTQKDIISKFVDSVLKSMNEKNAYVKLEFKSSDVPRGFKDDPKKVCNKLEKELIKHGITFIMEDDVDISLYGDLTIDTHIPSSLFSGYELVQDFFEDYVLENIEYIEDDWRKKRHKLIIPLIANGPISCKYKSSILKMLKEDLDTDIIDLTYNLESATSKESDSWFIEIK